ncbi:MAG: flagellar hook-associated protein FlgK [Nitrospinae bacterium]|nr:flagellar hook-associated protein FlgK [Nitrospinota bacterium]
MPSIYGTMNTAKMALITHQLSLEVTGQNISNVNNPNFTRQEVQLEAAFPIKPGGSPGLIGTGVRATAIVRRYDQFLEGQRVLNQANTGYWESRDDFMARLETVFNESSESGLNGLFNEFFLAFQDLAFNPRGLTERTNVTAQGRSMSTMFQKLAGDVTNMRVDLDTKITSSITEINRITGEIVDLNIAIHEAETHGVHANDFRDKREKLIRELGNYAEVHVVEDSNNQVTLSLKNGRTLAIGQTAFELSTRVRSDDPMVSDIYWKDTDGNYFNATSDFVNGKMGAWLELRDTDFVNYLDRLDQLAGTMIRDINSLHSSGYGLDGSTGVNFFGPLSVGTTVGRNNTSPTAFTGATAIVDPEKVSLNKYQITITGAGTFSVTDLTTGASSGAATYAAGTDIPFFLDKGIRIQLDSLANVGDTFTIHAGDNAALNMAVNSTVVSDLNKIAAGLSTLQGDGDNALRIAQLQNRMTMGKSDPMAASGTATFAQHYNAIVGDVGVSGKTAKSMNAQQEVVNFELENRHEQIAGVSLDEEMVNLIKFQHAYQASARLISVVDEMLQTLLGLGK